MPVRKDAPLIAAHALKQAYSVQACANAKIAQMQNATKMKKVTVSSCFDSDEESVGESDWD